MTNNMTPEAVYMRIRHLIETMPNLENIELTPETYRWLGGIQAIIQESSGLGSSTGLKITIDTLIGYAGSTGPHGIGSRHRSAREIRSTLYTALEIAELRAPASVQESFISAGADFDAFAAVSKVFSKASAEILIVDPYLDEKIFTDFMPAIPEGVTARLLASEKNHKRGILQPAFSRWIKQYGSTRPIELRVVSHSILHDRLVIIDSTEVWLLSQSFNAFAERASASIVRSQDPELKIEAYNDIWNNAQPIQS